MTKTKEQLVEALCSDYDIVDGFVRFGLEYGLEGLLEEINKLKELDHLPDHKSEDLLDQCKTATAFVKVLRYYTTNTYDTERRIIAEGLYKWVASH